MTSNPRQGYRWRNREGGGNNPDDQPNQRKFGTRRVRRSRHAQQRVSPSHSNWQQRVLEKSLERIAFTKTRHQRRFAMEMPERGSWYYRWRGAHHQNSKNRKDDRLQRRRDKALEHAALASGGHIDAPADVAEAESDTYYTGGGSAADATDDVDELERRRVLPHVRFLALPSDCNLTLEEANIYRND